MQLKLQLAQSSDLETVLTLVRQFHASEAIVLPESVLRSTLAQFLENDRYGRLWQLMVDDQCVGYIALCFGFSFEFGGPDAFIDELFIVEEFRGKKLGRMALEQVSQSAFKLGIKALHLEVNKGNIGAEKLYKDLGFRLREQNHLMTLRTSSLVD